MILIAVMVSMGLMAQDKYQEAMQAGLEKFGSASGVNELQAAALHFERIAEVETEEWLPAYYASLIYCIIAFRTEDVQEKEKFVRQAQTHIDEAMKATPDESEVHTLQGMVYQALIGVDPASNGQIYGSKANGSFQTAIRLNSENPRPYYLQAVSLLYTPEQYGGGKKAALPLFEKAMGLFAKESPENSLYPDWGKEDCERNLKVCQEDQAGL
jgi:hypothetical protein